MLGKQKDLFPFLTVSANFEETNKFYRDTRNEVLVGLS